MAVPLPWIRLHVGWLANPKIGLLPAALQLAWVKLITIAGSHGGVLPQNLGEIAFTLRCSAEEVRSMLEQLEKARLFEQKNGCWTPHDFDDWQYRSDSSTERSRKHREAQRCSNVAATDQCNVAATDQSRAEQSRDRAEHTPLPPAGGTRDGEPSAREANTLDEAFHRFFRLYPKKERADAASRAWVSLVGQGVITDAILPKVMSGLAAYKSSKAWEEDGGKYVPRAERFLFERMWQDDPEPSQTAKLEALAKQPWTGTNPYQEFPDDPPEPKKNVVKERQDTARKERKPFGVKVTINDHAYQV